MPITVSTDAADLKRVRKGAWAFRRTFKTPLKNLRPFVAEIVATLGAVQSARVTIELVVFEPRKLAELTGGAVSERTPSGTLLVAQTPEDVAALLEAALGDWVDFTFVPTPKPVVIYADHDEYTTILATTKAGVERVAGALERRGFEEVRGYRREFG